MLKVENAAYGYKKSGLLYDNVNFEVSSGEILSILGPNGSGKTTLLRCVMNFLHFTTGCTYIDNNKLSEYGNKDLWKIISYVPQAKAIASQLNALEMVMLGRIPFIQGFRQPKADDYRAAKDALNILGIQYLTYKQCDTISGGELQMVLLARALVSDPKILILDEPESNLDFKNQIMILKYIKKLSVEKDIICIINTHYPDHALEISDKILLINKTKRKTIFGQVHDVLSESNLKDIFGIEVIVEKIIRNNNEYSVVVPMFRLENSSQKNNPVCYKGCYKAEITKGIILR